jgi:Ca-activated chloride channel family protein
MAIHTIKLSGFRGKIILAAFVGLLCSQSLNAQSDRKYIRQGNREYEKSKYSDSEILYRKAADKNKNDADALFNTGAALYKQKKFEDAGKEFVQNENMNEDRRKKSEALYNLGNSFLKANKFKESIEAYENSLKLNPGNPEAKYNLAYAQDMLKQQQQQQQQQQKQNQQQQQNKDKNDKDKDKNKKEQNNDKQDQNQQNQQNQNQQNQQNQQQQGISKDDAERLLNALANEEKNVQEKVKLAKAAKEKVRTLKNW